MRGRYSIRIVFFHKLSDNSSMIRTLAVYVYIFFSVTIVSMIAFFTAFICLFGMRKFMPYVIYRIVQAWAISVIKIIGCKITVTGTEHIPKKGGICFVCNHGSIFDIVVLIAYVGRPLGFIAKKELVYVPFINIWIKLLGGHFIDRKNLRKSLRTINKGVGHIKSGGAMAIFPEGHRSRGQGLLPFHSGSLKLATQAEAPIIPIAISGSYDVFEKNYRVYPAPIALTIGEMIPTAGLPKEERKHILTDQVYQIISAALTAHKPLG